MRATTQPDIERHGGHPRRPSNRLEGRGARIGRCQIPGLNPSAQSDQLANMILSILLGLSILGSLVDIIRTSLREMRSPVY